MYSGNDRFPRPVLEASASRVGASASLTYEPFYGLREKPFSLSADPRFLFRSPAHGPAFDEIQAGIRRREGLIVLTGEIGTGKTTLCRSVLDQLDRRTFAAFVADPFVSREDLLKTLLVDFGVVSIGDLTRGRFNGASRSDLSYPLYEFLDSLVPLQAFAVVVIDEAQNLSLPLLEEIRILSELERREKLLQVVLVGQPELCSSLRLPEMRQLDQRVSVRCELTALDAAGVAGYVSHRLSVAGCGESRVEFTHAALEAIYEGSSGVPRMINRICDRALQRAHVSGSMQVDEGFVLVAIDDLGLGTAAARKRNRESNQEPAAVRPPSVSVAPVEPGGPVAAAEIDTQSDSDAIGLTEFLPESACASSASGSMKRSAARYRWVGSAAAALLAASASVSAGAWYAYTQAVDGHSLTTLVPPRPAQGLSKPGGALSLNGASSQQSSPETAGDGVQDPPASGYSILVASFEHRSRADRLVEELTTAGYGAHAEEREGGPTGRLLQVRISGYTSAIDVQRDLERIRELPGGYSDARIVERD
jgi:general secretion pathway protein A